MVDTATDQFLLDVALAIKMSADFAQKVSERMREMEKRIKALEEIMGERHGK